MIISYLILDKQVSQQPGPTLLPARTLIKNMKWTRLSDHHNPLFDKKRIFLIYILSPDREKNNSDNEIIINFRFHLPDGKPGRYLIP
jgi:hypothetical protein